MADAEHRQVALGGAGEQRQLVLVGDAVDLGAERRVAVLAVDGGVEVGAAAYEQAVEAVEQRARVVDVAMGRQHDGDATRLLHRLGVGQPHREALGREVALAAAGRHRPARRALPQQLVRDDADQRRGGRARDGGGAGAGAAHRPHRMRSRGPPRHRVRPRACMRPAAPRGGLLAPAARAAQPPPSLPRLRRYRLGRAREGGLHVRVLRRPPRRGDVPLAPAPDARPALRRVRRRGAGALADLARPAVSTATRAMPAPNTAATSRRRCARHYGTVGRHPWAMGPHPWAGRRGTDRARRLARSLGSTFGSP